MSRFTRLRALCVLVISFALMGVTFAATTTEAAVPVASPSVEVTLPDPIAYDRCGRDFDEFEFVSPPGDEYYFYVDETRDSLVTPDTPTSTRGVSSVDLAVYDLYDTLLGSWTLNFPNDEPCVTEQSPNITRIVLGNRIGSTEEYTVYASFTNAEEPDGVAPLAVPGGLRAEAVRSDGETYVANEQYFGDIQDGQTVVMEWSAGLGSYRGLTPGRWKISFFMGPNLDQKVYVGKVVVPKPREYVARASVKIPHRGKARIVLKNGRAKTTTYKVYVKRLRGKTVRVMTARVAPNKNRVLHTRVPQRGKIVVKVKGSKKVLASARR